jgi:hypothetical protein
MLEEHLIELEEFAHTIEHYLEDPMSEELHVQ